MRGEADAQELRAVEADFSELIQRFPDQVRACTMRSQDAACFACAVVTSLLSNALCCMKN